MAAASAVTATTSKTRVCVKNLPPSATERDLREFFRESAIEKVEITDCKVLKNVKGKSRKVAFLGFRKEEQAAYIVSHFHRSFMGMSRLSVEHAIAKMDESKEEQKTATKGENETKSLSKKKSAEKESRHKKEILELVGGGQKSKFWANDEAPALQPEGDGDVALGVEDEASEPQKNTKSTKHETTNSENDSSSSDESDTDLRHDDDLAIIQQSKEVGLSDLDFLRSKQKATDDLEADGTNDLSDLVGLTRARENDVNTDSDAGESDSASSSDDTSSSDDDEDENSAKALVDDNTQHESMKEGDSAARHTETNEEVDDGSVNDEEDAKKEETSKSRLFVRNLPFETTEEELDDYFSRFGKLVECHIPVDDLKRNKGFAFIQYASAVDALEARKQLDKVDFQGRLLHILPAKPAPKQVAPGDENLTWKQKQEIERKKQDTSNGDSKGWSATFVRGDAVVDNLAERLGLRKADFLGVKDKLSSGDAAVRLALGETQIIEENREYFRLNGVDMEALVLFASGKETQRSKTSILVKNLPFDTHVDELNKLFQMGDESVKIFLPPSRTIALVVYGHHSDAKKAFKRLAYRRFKHVPIYLEWAPLAATAEDGDKAMEKHDDSPPTSQKVSLSVSVDDSENDLLDGSVSTVYVKNLNFASTEETLRQVFEKNVGKVRSVRIPQKVTPSRSGEEPQLMSMGYGFVELESEVAVKKALQVLQGKLVDGHAWEVTVSTNKTGKSKLTPSTKNPTKLIVRNVPFQATRSDILKLFGSFGQLRRVRLPKKFDGSHRGFAFVEFLTSKEAVAAMNALARTHLYGRHLVLEWASDEEDLEQLREKAQRDAEPPLPKNKRIKFT
jgi:multiple RNA-binding domain-containing protein 1